MSAPISSKSALSSPPSARDRADSRGSVLVFVVGILLLLAIVATAFLGTSRADRTSTQQNAYNTQIDLLVEGVTNAAKSKASADESIAGHPNFEAFDAYTTANQLGRSSDDGWLASRVPLASDPTADYDAGVDNIDMALNRAYWPTITGSVLGDSFESPAKPAGVYAGSLQYSSRERMYPTFMLFNGKRWPAFRVDTFGTPLPGNTLATTRYQTFLAGDADGDGVADSGLFRLPIGQLAGVTYFGAVRIIDNNSAINVSTAMSRDWQFLGNGDGGRNVAGSPLLGSAGQFASSVGLLEMLRSYPLVTAPPPPQFDNMASGTNEFTLLNDYRLGIANTYTSPRMFGVANSLVPIAQPASDTGVLRPDFQYDTMGQALSESLGQRMKNPSYVSSTSGTPTKGKAGDTDALAFAAHFAIGSRDDASNALVQALTSSVRNDPAPFTLRQTPYDYATIGSGIDGWFLRNFNYASETFSDPTPDTATFMNRKTILVGTNPTSNLDAAPTYAYGNDRDTIRPPEQLYNFNTLGTLADANAANGSNLYRQRDSYGNLVPAVGNQVQPPMMIPGGTTGTLPRSKVSINTARFEELFYGFFKVMARENFLGDGLGGGTPYSNFYNGAIAARNGIAFNIATGEHAAQNFYYRDPYVGMRFTPAIGMNGVSANRLDPRASVANNSAGPEQHPLRQFRSVLRAPHDRGNLLPATGFWDANTPYLPPDQVLILRAAIAAANAEALRNNSGPVAGGTAPTQDQHNDRIVPHQVPLTAYLPPRPPANEFTDPATPQRVVANVYGLRRQPYITEVFVDTDEDTADGDPANPRGYIAIKLYNPHPVAISLQHCRLVGLRRYRESVSPTPLRGTPTVTQYPHMQVLPYPATALTNATTNDQLDLSTLLDSVTALGADPWVIPANGYLVIENYPGLAVGADPTTDATHRSTAIDLINRNLFTGTGPALNNTRVAYLPFLSSVVYDRELVLMRPLGAIPPATPTGTLTYVPEDLDTTALDLRQINRYAPLDSYDFTGLNYPNAVLDGPIRARAQRWHYKRPSRIAGVRDQWRWVYPGRYDANQSIQAGGFDPRPRQQGTNEAYNTLGTLGRVVTPPETWQTSPLYESPTLVGDPVGVFYYPDTGFKIPLNDAGFPSERPLHATPPAVAGAPVNFYPYGGFRRMGDLLQVPFIGSYTIQTELDAITPASANTFVEVNAVTMDAALAEDTDTVDNPTAADVTASATTLVRSREQIGRFCPLRPSVGTGTPGDPVNEGTPDANDRRWVFVNNATFTNDRLRYQDDIDDDTLRQYQGEPYGAGALVPPTTPAQDFTNRYAWTRTLFDHFTIQAPQDDYFGPYPTQPRWRPATRYLPGDAVQFGADTFVCVLEQTPALGADDPPPITTLNPAASTNYWQRLERAPVANSNAANVGSRNDIAPGSASFLYNPAVLPANPNNDIVESAEPLQGLVNINTAPERVLAMIPWLPPGDNFTFRTTPPYVLPGGDGDADNEEVARRIVAYRDGALAGPLARGSAHEPFRSIYDLYKIPWMQWVQRELLVAADPLPLQGDFSTNAAPAADGTRNDFEEQYLLMNRVSNLITTRSDAFTIYVLVQGWRNVGSTSPELVSQRRAAVMVDRSRMSYEGTETLKQLSKIPTQ